MEIDKDRLASLKRYCCDSGEADDGDLTELYAAALGYMENAGVTMPQAGTARRAQFDLCVNYLVLDAYDKRVTTITGTIVAENPGFRRQLNQLKQTDLKMRF